MGVTVHGFTLNVWGSEVLHFEMHRPSRGVERPERTADHYAAKSHVHPRESRHQGTHDHSSGQDVGYDL